MKKRGKKKKKKPKEQRAFLLQVQIANAVAYAPVVMWMAAAKQEREGGERRWREGR